MEGGVGNIYSRCDRGCDRGLLGVTSN